MSGLQLGLSPLGDAAGEVVHVAISLDSIAPAAQELGVVQRVFATGGSRANAVDFEQVDWERGIAAGSGAECMGNRVVAAESRLSFEQGGLQLRPGQGRLCDIRTNGGRPGHVDRVSPHCDTFVLLTQPLADEDAGAGRAIHADPLTMQLFRCHTSSGASAERIQQQVAFL